MEEVRATKDGFRPAIQPSTDFIGSADNIIFSTDPGV